MSSLYHQVNVFLSVQTRIEMLIKSPFQHLFELLYLSSQDI